MADFSVLGCKPASVSTEPNVKLSKDEGEMLKDPTTYKRLIGRLIYLTITRHDICYFVHRLSQFLAMPRDTHMKTTMKILQYIKGAPGQGLFFLVGSKIQLKAFVDSDWAAYLVLEGQYIDFVSFLEDH